MKRNTCLLFFRCGLLIALTLVVCAPQPCRAAVLTKSVTRIVTPGCRPISGAVAPNGDVYIGCYGGSVKKLDSGGNLQSCFTASGWMQAISETGKFYIADLSNNIGKILSPTGQQVGVLGRGAGEFVDLYSIRIDPYTGNVYAVDEDSDLVKIYAQDGTFIAQFTAGHHPKDIAFTTDKLYVSDSTQIYDPYAGYWIDGAGIGVYDRSGNHLFSFGTFGWDFWDPNQFAGPTGVVGIVANEHGNIYAGQSYFNSVSIFNSSGTVLGQTGHSGVYIISRIEYAGNGKIYFFNAGPSSEYMSVVQYDLPLANMLDTDGDWYPDVADNCPNTLGYQTDSDGDGIGNVCDPSTCGNGVLEAPEACDDGNQTNGDGCSSLCLLQCVVQEICGDGVDNNCNGSTDEEPCFTCADNDGDGYSPDGNGCGLIDCNDGDPGIHPSATEICDGEDNNCNGNVDEGVKIVYYIDADGDGYGSAIDFGMGCSPPAGYVANFGDCNDNPADPLAAATNPAASEICNDGIDNNCDGLVDGDIPTTYYLDADHDGYGDPGVSMESCDGAPTGYVQNGSDCNDAEAGINPGAQEICDGIDNNCDGLADAGIPWHTNYLDTDHDGYGDPSVSMESCSAAPAGYVQNGGDCNDADAGINPAAQEICDGIDNNCDGFVDAGIPWHTNYLDTDHDGYGDPDVSMESCGAAPAGYVQNGGDCNDADAGINPAAQEICDGIDNNCDGQINEGLLSTFWPDSDGDGFGDGTASSVEECTAPFSYVDNDFDCADNDANVYPGAEEVPSDNIDNNCNGFIDESAAAVALPSTGQTYNSIQEAYNTITGADTIKVKAIEIIENLSFDRNVTLTLSGGYDEGFFAPIGWTVISSPAGTSPTILIINGTVIADRIFVR